MSGPGDSPALWAGGRMLSPFGSPLNDEQAAATVDRDRPLLLEASAGAGKTMVLVERFVRDVLEGGTDGVPLDCSEILAITFTRKAAAELRRKIRTRFVALARDNDRARAAVGQLDGASISTIDSFCSTLVRRHALLIGFDPAFALIDEIELGDYRRRAFYAAADRLSGGSEADRALDLFAAEGFDRLIEATSDVYEQLRSAGQAQPRLPAVAVADDPGRWVELLDQLLLFFGEQYSALKRAGGGCDFADVVFAARDLLVQHPSVAGSYRERFKRVLIDEFQDTNRLQVELFEALAVPSQFQVGDPLQSIYGFRSADLGVFIETAERLDKQGQKLRLTENYRSRPEILSVINAGLCDVHAPSGIEWAQITGGNSDHAAGTLPLVELLFTDEAAWEDGDLGPAEAEARLVASRIKQLLDDREATSGEIVILMETRSRMGVFRAELERLGIDAVADGGEDWWHRIELVDLLAQLRLLANRADEQALLGALRSPFCGLSLDGLALIGAEKLRVGTATLWQIFELACGAEVDSASRLSALGEPDRELLRSYRSLLAGWELAAERLGVGAMLDRVVEESGYASILLSGSDGTQRLANLRKLLAVAHNFERLHGSGLRQFVAWAQEASIARSNEIDAPVGREVAADDETDSDPSGPVRLMTIHSAKGLQYPVVVVPALGAGVKGDSPMIRVAGNRVACSLYCAGAEGKKGQIGPFDALKQEANLEAHCERRRKIHVAVTRPQRRLILSGCGKPDASWNVDDTGSAACLIWMVPGLLGAGAADILAGGGDHLIEVEGEHGSGQLKLVISRPDRAAELFADAVAVEPPGPLVSATPIVPEPAHLTVSSPPTISYSLLARVAQCPYRWYLENVVGLPQRTDDGFSDGSLGARARGTLAHLLLEQLEFRPGEAVPTDDRIIAVAATVDGADSDDDSVKDQRTMLAGFVGGKIWQELAGADEVERESSFALEIVQGDRSLPVLIGTVDALAEFPDGRILVVDYKTDRVTEQDDLTAKVEDRYRLQRDAYALAALRRGAKQVEVVHCFLGRPDERISATYLAVQEAEIVERLRAAAETVTKADFPVAAAPNADLCTGCPGRPIKGVPGLCSYSESETSR